MKGSESEAEKAGREGGMDGGGSHSSSSAGAAWGRTELHAAVNSNSPTVWVSFLLTRSMLSGFCNNNNSTLKTFKLIYLINKLMILWFDPWWPLDVPECHRSFEPNLIHSIVHIFPPLKTVGHTLSDSCLVVCHCVYGCVAAWMCEQQCTSRWSCRAAGRCRAGPVSSRCSLWQTALIHCRSSAGAAGVSLTHCLKEQGLLRFAL